MTPREITLRSTVPLVINVFNQHRYLEDMVRQFSESQFRNIIVLDNGSSYGPLLDYYKQLTAERKVNIIYYNHNRGPHYFFLNNIHRHLFEHTPFLYTDPDLAWDTISEEFLTQLFEISHRYRTFKVGCALQLPSDDTIKPNLPSFNFNNKSFTVREWEEQFWQDPIQKDIYAAPIDTTMHLFNPAYYTSGQALITGLRVAGDGMTATHLPWFKDDPCPPEEMNFYRSLAKHSNWQS
jgi:hypothetical protein